LPHCMTDDDSLIEQQIEYYRLRAPEYNEWFYRIGRYDRGEEHRRQWFAELLEVRQALESSRPAGSILELACGTGIWTEQLAAFAQELMAVDISPEAIEINRLRVADKRIRYIEADLFSWTPRDRFDYVFFGFWLSHVPIARFDQFWAMVEKALASGGKVFFVDSLLTEKSTAGDHAPVNRSGRTIRKLNDGREFEIVKIFHRPSELEHRLCGRGWTGYVLATGTFFLYGCVTR
jgi:2-polyprenyl-3-methyl-5-hydroxy-6-metoxy-1,4-benzoquinol methylase